MDRGAWWQKHWTGLSNQTTATSVQTRLDLEPNEKGRGEPGLQDAVFTAFVAFPGKS